MSNDTRYGKIAHELREQITTGTYRAGDILPSIPELMDRHSAARDTVRDAVALLAREGLVTPQRGVGTVVRDISAAPLRYRPGAPSRTWAAQFGEDAADVVVLAERTTADPDIAGRLNILAGTSVVHRVRHQSRGEGVVQIHEQWIPATIADAVRDKAGTNLEDTETAFRTDLFSLMRESGVVPVSTTETIGARTSTPDEADTFGTPADSPVVLTHRVTVADKDVPVETSTIVGAADRVSHTFTVPLDSD